jgi:hypothetical protein
LWWRIEHFDTCLDIKIQLGNRKMLTEAFHCV